MNLLICPKCGKKAVSVDTRWGRKRNTCYDCGLWSWGDAPLVDRETHEARKAGHIAFDALWQSGRVKRAQAYALLATALKMHPRDCHMKLMDAQTARKVPEAVLSIRYRLDTGGG